MMVVGEDVSADPGHLHPIAPLKSPVAVPSVQRFTDEPVVGKHWLGSRKLVRMPPPTCRQCGLSASAGAAPRQIAAADKEITCATVLTFISLSSPFRRVPMSAQSIGGAPGHKQRIGDKIFRNFPKCSKIPPV